MNKANSIAEIIAHLEKLKNKEIIQPANFELLKKLIEKADSLSEALLISELGTTYKKTGFHFNPQLSKITKTNTIHYLSKNKNLSFETDNTKIHHELIIGENFFALENLLIEYSGLIDVIYIDPPYSKDSMGQYAVTNYENCISRDNLLSSLYERLKLAQLLLQDNGIILCSIDEKNQAYVKGLFDEIFGENNFAACFSWVKTDTAPFLSNSVRRKIEYVLCYKNKALDYKLNGGITDGGDVPLLNSSNSKSVLKFPKETLLFKLKDGEYDAKNYECSQLMNCVQIKDGRANTDVILKGHFKWTQQKVDDEIKNGTCFIIKTEKFSIRFQRIDKSVKIPSNFISKEECNVGTNEEGTKTLKSIMGYKCFDNPKPCSLIQYLVNLNPKKDALVLDFYAGTGTTGQAVLELNKLDNGKRKFILCTNNEKDEINKNGIAIDVTIERLKRVMTGKSSTYESDFEWIKKNKPLGDNLDVYDIKEVANFETAKGKSAFEVIDETDYGMTKFETKREKIEWVCSNFEDTQKVLENHNE